jgi:hypothetical protein
MGRVYFDQAGGYLTLMGTYDVTEDFSFTGVAVRASGLDGVFTTDGTLTAVTSQCMLSSITLGNEGEFTNVLTVSSVPEPSTYAAFAGLAVLGCAALIRRRRK